MKSYLVGGAVRDQLLGLPVEERDWVVVGSTPEKMLALGYQQVGRDFPVFLHPDSKEEYALARTERKLGEGHTGFQVFASKEVSLEDDLLRRDLTINAIAQTEGGQLIDPYNGLQDLNQRRLKHVSDAFVEDPLRVLRAARFHAKLHHLGFELADETRQLLQHIARSGELATLSAERVWRECEKALAEVSPDVFLQTLYSCDALATLIPELDRCFLQQDNLLDAEAKIGERTLGSLRYAAKHQLSTAIRWALVTHALEINTQPQNIPAKNVTVPRNQDSVVKRICIRLKVPNEYRALAMIVAAYGSIAIQALQSRPDTIVDMFDACDAWRKPEQFSAFLQCCEAINATNPNQSHKNLGSIALLRTAHQQCKQISADEFIKQGISGAAIGESIRNARKVHIASLKKQFL